MARWVKQHYNLPMITEVARSVLGELETDFAHLRTDVDLVGEYQKEVFCRQMEVEKQYGDNFVSDRAFDNLAYAADHTLVLHQLLAPPSGPNSVFTAYLEHFRTGIVFFLRPHPELCKNDLVRQDAQWTSVVRIDGMVKLLLELFEIPYIPIESLSMQERVRAISYILDRSK